MRGYEDKNDEMSAYDGMSQYPGSTRREALLAFEICQSMHSR